MINAIVEAAVAIFMIFAGYTAVICFLHEKKPNAIDISKLSIKGKNRLLYLLTAVLAAALLIAAFGMIYVNNGLIHNLKLIILVLVILPSAAVDYRVQKIPNIFLLAALILRLVLYIYEFSISVEEALNTVKDNIFGALIIGAFFIILRLVIKNSIGMGDIKLFMIMGLYQGIWGAINSVFFSLVASFFVSLVLLISKKKNKKDMIAFGPCIFVGTVAAILLSGI